MHDTKIIAPWYVYAQNKVKARGGILEDYVEEYHQKHERLSEILKEKELCDKTLVDTGLLEQITIGARTFGLHTPVDCYQQVIDIPAGWNDIASILGIDRDRFEILIKDIEKLLGEEYISIFKDLRKYT